MIQRAKLHTPTIASEALMRSRILAILDSIPDHRLTLIAAPSGFGKTTAVRQWQRSRPELVHWLTLDREDADPERLIQHVIAALSTGGRVVGRNTLDLLNEASRPSPVELAEVLADEFYEDDATRILILDECELLHIGPSWQFIDTLIKSAPEWMHIVCISRIDPPLPLARYRTRGQLLELRGSDLQFSPAETEELLDLRSGRHSHELATALQRQTHGWPAAVTLATLALKQSDSWEPLADYRIGGAPFDAMNALAQDVLAGTQPLDRQAYAMVALVDPISPVVLAAMLERPIEDADALLQAMQKSGLTTGIVDERGIGYQLHPLFRDLFLHQMPNAEPASTIREWHARAASALEQQRDIPRAVRHWLLAEQQERALDLLETVIPRAFEQEKWSEVAEKLSSLPESLILARPSLAFGWCWTLFVRGQWSALEAFTERVGGMLAGDRWRGNDLHRWQASFDVLRTFGIYQSNIAPEEMLRLLEIADAALDVEHAYVRGYSDFQRVWALQSTGQSTKALRAADEALSRFGGAVDGAYGRAVFSRVLLLRQQGEIGEAEATGLANIEILRRRGYETACAWLNMLLGWIAYERNDLDRAISVLREVAVDYRDVHALTVRESMNLLAVVHGVRGEWEEAWAVMRRLREILVELGATELMHGVLVTEAWLARQQDGAGAAPVSGIGSIEEAQRTTPALVLHPAELRIRLHIAASDLASALEEIALFRRIIDESHCEFRQPQIDLLESVTRWRRGETAEALRLLRRALRHPASRFMQREFMNYDTEVTRMLDRLRAESAPEVSLPLIAVLSQASAPPVVAEPAPEPGVRRADQELIRLLTAREYSVLEGLSQRLSYKEIAEQLSISPATVKRHAGNVYLKLDASNRREAIARAIELGFSY